MKKTLMPAAVAMASAIGCVPMLPQRTVDAFTRTTTEKGFDRSYVLGQRQSVFVGQAAVRVKDVTFRRTHGAFVAPSVAGRVRVGSDEWLVEPSRPLPVRAVVTVEGDDYSLAEIAVIPGIVTFTANALVSADGTPYRRIAMSNGQKTFLMKGAALFEPAPMRFYPTSETVTATGAGASVNFEILYSGTDGRSISLTYREYTSAELARPAFSQALVYPIGTETIRFRTVQLRVFGATSEALDFAVVQDGLGSPAPSPVE